MNEMLPISMLQLMLPPICVGTLLAGFVLFVYMSIRYRSRLYFSIAILGVVGLLFVGSEMLILSFGGVMRDAQLAREFHRTEQLAGAFFLFVLPYLLQNLLMLPAKWKKINIFIAYAGLAIAVSISVVAYVSPDLFISMTVQKSFAARFAADYGRGSEGIVYRIRDLLLAVYIVYALVCILIDLNRNRRFSSLLALLLGIVFAIYGAVIDIVFVYKGFNIDPFTHLYFSRFSLALTVMIVLCMGALTRRFIDSAREVERMHKIITISEEKYRLLVEGTHDCIFAIDENFSIINANRAMLNLLRFDAETIRTKTIFDIISDESEKDIVMIAALRDKLKNLISRGSPVESKVMLRSAFQTEPVEYSLRLEHISIDDRREILGKAVRVGEDALIKYFESEKQRYVIGNYLITAEEISKRLVRNLVKYIDQSQVNILRIGLREMIINAIEHGNLNITFEEKSAATMDGNYLEFVMAKQGIYGNNGKKVIIDYSLDTEKAVYTITDEGEGFDYHVVMDTIRNKVNEDMLAHGRGILMAYNVFDEVFFNEKGNQVSLVKKFINSKN